MDKNIEYVPVWRVQVWEVKSKHHHLIEAELYETEEEAEMKSQEFLEKYPENEGYRVKLEKDFLKLAKQFINPIMPTIPPM